MSAALCIIVSLLCLVAGCRSALPAAPDAAPAGRIAGIPASDVHPAGYVQVAEPEPAELSAPRVPPVASSALGLADLEALALQNNPALSQAAARVDAARGRWLQVGLWPNPEVGYSGQQLGSRGLAEQQGVFIGQELVTGRKLSLSRQLAGWRVRRAEQTLDAFRLRVLTDVRIAYYDVLIAQRRRELTTELVAISDQALQAANALFQGEEVGQADPLRAQIEVDMAQVLLQSATNQHLEAWRRLTAVIGMPEWEVQRLDGSLRPEAAEWSWQDALRRLLTESPELAAAGSDVEAARWAVRRANAEVVPNVEVQGVIQGDQATGSSNGNLQVSLPIPIFNRNQGGISQAEADVVASERARDRLALDLQTRLASAFQRYQSARSQVESYSKSDGILDNARKSLELVRAGYQAGEFGVVDLLTAQRTYFQTNLAYLDALRDLWTASLEIRGMLLRNSLSS